MNINDFVVLPGSKTGISVKLKEKSVRELQLEKVQLELDNKEMEKKLKQLQSNMSREKQDRGRAEVMYDKPATTEREYLLFVTNCPKWV